jgi:hypothetical protein
MRSAFVTRAARIPTSRCIRACFTSLPNRGFEVCSIWVTSSKLKFERAQRPIRCDEKDATARRRKIRPERRRKQGIESDEKGQSTSKVLRSTFRQDVHFGTVLLSQRCYVRGLESRCSRARPAISIAPCGHNRFRAGRQYRRSCRNETSNCTV